MRFFWPRTESRIYDEAKRLVERGLAVVQDERAGRRPRQVYRITDEGRDEIQRWLATPPRATALECEPLLRIYLADLSTRDQLFVALDQLRADADAILNAGREAGSEYLQGTAPFQDQVHVRGLVFDFLWSHAKMLRGWADRAEEAIRRWDELSPEEREVAALEVIRGHLAADRAR